MSPDPLDTMPVDIALFAMEMRAGADRRNRSREETRTFRTTIRKAGDIDLQ